MLFVSPESVAIPSTHAHTHTQHIPFLFSILPLPPSTWSMQRALPLRHLLATLIPLARHRPSLPLPVRHSFRSLHSFSHLPQNMTATTVPSTGQHLSSPVTLFKNPIRAIWNVQGENVPTLWWPSCDLDPSQPRTVLLMIPGT